jgi:hypothetical protein
MEKCQKLASELSIERLRSKNDEIEIAFAMHDGLVAGEFIAHASSRPPLQAERRQFGLQEGEGSHSRLAKPRSRYQMGSQVHRSDYFCYLATSDEAAPSQSPLRTTNPYGDFRFRRGISPDDCPGALPQRILHPIDFSGAINVGLNLAGVEKDKVVHER